VKIGLKIKKKFLQIMKHALEALIIIVLIIILNMKINAILKDLKIFIKLILIFKILKLILITEILIMIKRMKNIFI
jgi:hypothetical protein